MQVYSKIALALFPKKVIRFFDKLLSSAGYEKGGDEILGKIFLINIISVFIILLLHFNFIILPVAIAIPYLLLYLFLLLKIDAREKEIEKNLPDFLQLASANIRAGMTIDQALWFAIREQYGILAKEMKQVAKENFSGTPLTEAFNRLKNKYRSKILKRAMVLIIEGLNSGGKMAEILERVAWDIQKTFTMRKEVAANVKMYEMFILFAVIIGAPALFGLSHYLLKMMTSLGANKLSAEASSVMGRAGVISVVPTGKVISPETFFYFAISCITVTSLFSSFIISIISKGRAKEGIKMFPVILIVSLLCFLAVSKALNIILSAYLI